MKRQLQKAVGVIISVYLSCFLTGRVVLLTDEYQKAQMQLQDDIAHQSLCSDQFILSQMGQRGADGCRESRMGSKSVPLFSALRVVAEHTYVCGSTPCSEILHEVTATTSSTVALICCVVLSPSGLYKAAKWVLAKRRSRKLRHYNGHHDDPHDEADGYDDEEDSGDMSHPMTLITPLYSKPPKTKTQ
jgi:hypothetical protein